MLDAEAVQLGDHQAAQVVLAPVGRGERADEQVERALEVALVQRPQRLLVLAELLQAQPGGEPLGLEAGQALDELRASSRRPSAYSSLASSVAASTRPGASSSARRSDSSSPASTSRSTSDGTRRSKNCSTCAGGSAP